MRLDRGLMRGWEKLVLRSSWSEAMDRGVGSVMLSVFCNQSMEKG